MACLNILCVLLKLFHQIEAKCLVLGDFLLLIVRTSNFAEAIAVVLFQFHYLVHGGLSLFMFDFLQE